MDENRVVLTITEALAEIKMIEKRVEKKTAFISDHICRHSRMKDPLLGDGGERDVISRERQAIDDLLTRLIGLRRGIQDVNALTHVTVENVMRTVADWLVWRREVADKEKSVISAMRSQIKAARDYAKQHNGRLVSGDVETPDDMVLNVDEVEVQSRWEAHSVILDTLDGQLSLINATTYITIA